MILMQNVIVNTIEIEYKYMTSIIIQNDVVRWDSFSTAAAIIEAAAVAAVQIVQIDINARDVSRNFDLQERAW